MSNTQIYVYDPTATDEQSRVRGVGRYLQTMHEYLRPEFTFTNDLKSIPYDSIFINPFFDPLKPPLKFLKRVAKKQIAVIHDLIPLKYPLAFPIGLKGKLYKLLNTLDLPQYDLIITDSIESKKSIIALLKIPDAKIKVIYATVPRIFLPHVDTSTESAQHHHPFHKESEHSVAEFTKLPTSAIVPDSLKNLKDYVVYVGDATWNKNLLNIARGIQMAKITCVCVGKIFSQTGQKGASFKPHPWLAPLYEFLKQVENDKQFIFPGFISDTALLELYKNAKANILLSYDEGFGLSFIEAGYTSTPSLLSNIPIFHEIAKTSAHFANPNDPKDIAQNLTQLFYDNMLREKMSIEAFERAQDFNPDLFRNNWLTVSQNI